MIRRLRWKRAMRKDFTDLNRRIDAALDSLRHDPTFAEWEASLNRGATAALLPDDRQRR